jgi:hypothetical protein
MDIVLIVATLVVAVVGLYVAVTFGRRTRQNFAPLIDSAVKEVSERVEAIAEDLRGRIRVIADELQRDRDQTRLDARKTQGRLDHADSRTTSISSQLETELDTIRRLVEAVGARQEQLLAGPRPGAAETTAPNPALPQQAETTTEVSGAPVPPPRSTWWERPPPPD